MVNLVFVLRHSIENCSTFCDRESLRTMSTFSIFIVYYCFKKHAFFRFDWKNFGPLGEVVTYKRWLHMEVRPCRPGGRAGAVFVFPFALCPLAGKRLSRALVFFFLPTLPSLGKGGGGGGGGGGCSWSITRFSFCNFYSQYRRVPKVTTTRMYRVRESNVNFRTFLVNSESNVRLEINGRPKVTVQSKYDTEV